MNRATPLLSVLFLALNTLFVFGSAQTDVRIGYQRGGLSTVLREQQRLETALGEDVRVTWTLFPAGPQLLEAMNAGAIDFGSTGDTPPIFAQAAGVPLRYVAGQRSFSDEAVIVPAGSTIEGLADLQGKKVAYTVGSSANYTLIKALESVGLTLEDIESVPLAPSDARAAFQGGSVDAWVIWAPFLTSAQLELDATALVTRRALVDGRSYYLASETFAREHPDLLEVILDEHQTATTWADAHRAAYYALLEAETDIPVEVWEQTYAGRAFYPLEALTPEIIERQQQIADTFYGLGVLPDSVDIAGAVWLWQTQLAKQH
jgi:sulfonate transport system substrate-binding protein